MPHCPQHHTNTDARSLCKASDNYIRPGMFILPGEIRFVRCLPDKQSDSIRAYSNTNAGALSILNNIDAEYHAQNWNSNVARAVCRGSTGRLRLPETPSNTHTLFFSLFWIPSRRPAKRTGCHAGKGAEPRAVPNLVVKNANAKGVRIIGSPSILRWSGRASHLEATKTTRRSVNVG